MMTLGKLTDTKTKIHAGHIGIIWMSGKDAGIYALVDITSNPEFIYDSEVSTKYWVYEGDKNQRKLRIRCRYRLKLINNNHITKQELVSIPQLRNMSIFRQP